MSFTLRVILLTVVLALPARAQSRQDPYCPELLPLRTTLLQCQVITDVQWRFPLAMPLWKAGAVARLGIGDDHRSPAVLDPGNMPTHLLRNAVRIVEANQDQFITAWRNIHGA